MSQPPSENTILDPLSEDERGGISWLGVVIGLAIGLGLGLFYTWVIDPVVIRNVAPADLNSTDQQRYVIAIAQEYARQRDLQVAVNRLIEVNPESDPFQLAAQTACDLIRSGQVDNVASLEALRNLRAIYEPQGVVAACDTRIADTPVPVTLVASTPTQSPTPTLIPIASKTPTPVGQPPPINTPLPTITPDSTDGTTMRQAFLQPFCDPALSGIIEIYVRDASSLELPGVALEISWNNGQSRQTIYTGLKMERGDGYADFIMQAGETYRVSVLGEGQPSEALIASACDGDGTLTSYRVVMQRFFNP